MRPHPQMLKSSFPLLSFRMPGVKDNKTPSMLFNAVFGRLKHFEFCKVLFCFILFHFASSVGK